MGKLHPFTRTFTVVKAMETVIAALALLGVVVVIALQVWTRYVTRAPLPWTEEVARYCLIWAVYIGSARVMADYKHLTVDIVSKLPRTAQVWIARIACLMVVLASCFMTYVSYKYASTALGMDAPASDIPLVFVHGAAVLGFALMTIHSGVNLFKPTAAINRDSEEVVPV